jgi:hypothetical protein
MELFDMKITNVEPVYDFKKVAGGHFNVYFGEDDDSPFTLGFIPLLDARVKQDDNLFDYLKKTKKDLTASHAIQDLYDIGFPVDEWVKEYFEEARENVDPVLFDALVRFYTYVKYFNSSSGSLDSNDDNDTII